VYEFYGRQVSVRSEFSRTRVDLPGSVLDDEVLQSAVKVVNYTLGRKV
jgi:hypothetical protein